MLYRPIMLASWIFLVSSGLAQTPKPAGKPPVKPSGTPAGAAAIRVQVLPDGSHSLLWEISGNGLSSPSYLFGTMHILCAEDAVLSAGLKKVIQNTGQVYFETDLDDLEEMMGALRYARMNDGVKISDLVTPVELTRLEEYFSQQKTPLPFAMMNRFKPYFVTAMISEATMPCEEKSSAEQLIMTEVKKTDKDILGLETMAFQASLFDSIPYKKQAEDLVKYVDSVEQFKKNTAELISLYRKQDIDSLSLLVEKSDPHLMPYIDLLLYDRNRRWVSTIGEQAFFKPTLFAVGAGHLGGKKGLVRLLKEKGFTLKPVKN